MKIESGSVASAALRPSPKSSIAMRCDSSTDQTWPSTTSPAWLSQMIRTVAIWLKKPVVTRKGSIPSQSSPRARGSVTAATVYWMLTRNDVR